MTNVEAARALFRAFEHGDDQSIRRLCSADFRAVQNGAAPIDLPTVLAFSAAVRSVVTDFRYKNPNRLETANGFVEEHDVCGTLPDGTIVKLHVCVVAEMKDGKITHLREYFDSAAAAQIAAHLGAA